MVNLAYIPIPFYIFSCLLSAICAGKELQKPYKHHFFTFCNLYRRLVLFKYCIP